MKFSDGFWLNKKNYDVHYASQTYEITKSPKTLNVLATPCIIYNRGMTLSGPNLEITFSSPAKDIIKVSIVHFQGTLSCPPEFELNEDRDFTPVINETDDYAELISGNTKVVIKKGQTWEIDYFYKDKKLTGCGWRSTSYITENSYSSQNRRNGFNDLRYWDNANGKGSYLREQLNLDVNENIYGFGEKFTPFVKNGQTVEVWNADGGTCSEQSYKSVPFYISSQGYGLFVNTSDNVSFEVASDTVSKVSFTVADEKLEYFVISGENPHEIMSNYTFLTGRPALLPAKTFGLWLSTSFTTDYNEETVLSFIDGMAQRNIPLSVFHFDCFWMKEFEWTNMKWNTDCFPDPQGLINKIKDRNISICVWINPYIAQRSCLFKEGLENGYFIKNPDGSVFQSDMWQPGNAIVDFTNPDACKWFSDKLKKLFDMGISAIKTDFGERIPTDVKYHNNADPFKMHNYYSYLYNKTVFDALKEYYGENKACLFARSATAGCQQFPVHWGGDCSATYVSMAETLRGGLSLCCSGFGYFSHDISGFEATASPDIYKRWCAFGLLSSHSRLHGNCTYRVPWLFDEESVDVLRFFTKLKGRLMPYIYTQSVKTSQTGVPMMRAMFMDFPEDLVCLNLDKQYMFGDSLLVAPIFNEHSQAVFYLPEGKWTDIITNKTYEGGKYYKTTCSYTEIPLMAKENSIIVYGDFKNDFEYDYLENSEIVLYAPLENMPADVSVSDAEGNMIFNMTALKSGNKVTVSFTRTDKTFKFSVHGHKSVTVSSNSENSFVYSLD